MRVFYASASSPHAYFESNLWRDNLYLPLVDLGYDVVEFEYDLFETFQNLDPTIPKQKEFIDQNRPKLTQELLHQIKAAHATRPIDVFFSYFYDACVLPECIDEIRSMGIKTVNWYCNGSYQLHLVEQISPHYDWCLVPERFRLEDYRALGANPIYCQEAANPNIYKPYKVPLEFDVSFVGQAYGDRPAYVRYLVDQGIDIHVWGYGWKSPETSIDPADTRFSIRRVLYITQRLSTLEGWRAGADRMSHLLRPRNGVSSAPGVLNHGLPSHLLGGVLPDVEVIQMYSRSRINLGFSTCGNTHMTNDRILQVRLRDFEVPMSGGFYMVEYMEELEEFFESGEEIVCYTDPQDLSDKIKYYLGHDAEREAIRRRGYERCRRDHTWQKRFESTFEKIGLSPGVTYEP